MWNFIYFLFTPNFYYFFSAIFTLIPLPTNVTVVVKHLIAILFKIALMIPIAGISYEIIKFAGKNANNVACKMISYPGMMLQKLTTKEPDDEQLEVALASIKAVLFLEDKFNLKDARQKVVNLEEVDVDKLLDIESSNSKLDDFLE
jgi:uncharacterized protein YqhQ